MGMPQMPPDFAAITPGLFARHERIGDCDLYQADCLPILAAMQQEGGGKPLFDAVVTDPPYGIGADEGASKNKGKWGWKYHGESQWDRERPSADLFASLLRVSRYQIIWGGNYFTDYLPPTMRWLVWDKMQREFSLADCEFAWTNQQKASRIFDFSRGAAVRDGKEHPTQKPIAVMEWCLSFLPDARRIFDPFMGSGTTGVACVKTGRAFVGIERDPGYFDIACKRMADAHRQADLFVAKPDITKPTQDSFL
jgi:DNA modification methylase